MQPDWQIPRYGLAWLLIAYVGAIIPHMAHLPIWLIVTTIAALVWRIQIYRSTWRYPNAREKLLLLLLLTGGLLIHYGRFSGLDPMVALLVSAFTMKLLEMHRKRDVYVVVLLSYFVSAITCLYFQTIPAAIYVLFALIPVTAALIALHQSHGIAFAAPLRHATIVLLQSIPLMLILFLIMPRLGSLWAVPQQNRAVTGISDTMSPGDFTRLGRSAKTAFRVTFDGPLPARRQLYWRGLTLTQFDGRSWWQGGWQSVQMQGKPAQPWDQLIEREGQPLAYRITMEPSHARWLFALSTPLPLSEGIGLTRDFNLRSARKIFSKQHYSVTSWLKHKLESGELALEVKRAALQLPEGFNPQTRAIARKWRSESATAEQLIERVLTLFNREYFYTLQPPLLGRHSVDEFLWQSKRGFCEHFAGSFVFFMRAAGVPARVVAGYQGGEIHPDQGYLTVRQYDAHAWAEVWLLERGWVRVDPTFAVAPQRIESSTLDALNEDEGFLSDSPLALVRYRNIDWLNRLRLQVEALDYAWAKWVLSYEQVQQQTLLSLLGKINPLRIGLLLLAGAIVGLLPWLIMAWLRNRREDRDELDRLYLKFCGRMARAGLPRQIGEAPSTYATRAAEAFPDAAKTLKLIARYYQVGRYRGDKVSSRQVKVLLRQLNNL